MWTESYALLETRHNNQTKQTREKTHISTEYLNLYLTVIYSTLKKEDGFIVQENNKCDLFKHI